MNLFKYTSAFHKLFPASFNSSSCTMSCPTSPPMLAADKTRKIHCNTSINIHQQYVGHISMQKCESKGTPQQAHHCKNETYIVHSLMHPILVVIANSSKIHQASIGFYFLKYSESLNHEAVSPG